MAKPAKNKIQTLAGEFQNQLDLKNYCDSLFKINESAVKEIERLKEENKHLRELLQNSVPNLITGAHQISDEETICIEQIEKLKNVAGLRELSLDEVKKLDLLYKNLRLIRGQSTSNVKNEKIAIPAKTDDLLLIASVSRDEKYNGRD